jgi:hypothetical protein
MKMLITVFVFVALCVYYVLAIRGPVRFPATAPESSQIITFRNICSKNIPPEVVCELFSAMGDSLIIEKGDSCSTAFTIISRNGGR